MILSIIFSIICFTDGFSLLTAMEGNRSCEIYLEEIRKSQDYQERKIAVSYLNGELSQAHFELSIQNVRQAAVEEKKVHEQRSKSSERHEKVNRIIANVYCAVKENAQNVRKAFAAFEEAKGLYTWPERWFGAEIHLHGIPERDHALEKLYEIEGHTLNLYCAIIDENSGPACPEVIREVQKKFNIKKRAQEDILYCPHLLVNNHQAVKGFLEIGVKPYDWLHPFVDACEYPIVKEALKNNKGLLLKVLLEHYPAMATKKFLQLIICWDKDLAMLESVFPVYEKLGHHYPELPCECVRYFHSLSIMYWNWFIKKGFDINYAIKGSTVLDLFAAKVLDQETQPALNVACESQIKHLLQQGALFNNLPSLIATAQRKLSVLSKEDPKYDGFVSEHERKLVRESEAYTRLQRMIDILQNAQSTPILTDELV